MERLRCIDYLKYEVSCQHLQSTASDSYDRIIRELHLNGPTNQITDPKTPNSDLDMAINETTKTLAVAERLFHERFAGLDIPEIASPNSEKWKLVYWTYREWLKTLLGNYSAIVKDGESEAQKANALLFLLHESVLDAQMEQFRLIRGLKLSKKEIDGLRLRVKSDGGAAPTTG
jgi:hypothetical protein